MKETNGTPPVHEPVEISSSFWYLPIPTYAGCGSGVGLTPGGRMGLLGVPFAHDTQTTTMRTRVRSRVIARAGLLAERTDHAVSRVRQVPAVSGDIRNALGVCDHCGELHTGHRSAGNR